jgi:hypothetical protein
MRILQAAPAALLMAALLGTLPLRSAETATARVAPASAVATEVGLPKPLLLIGQKTGPCSISVLCKSGVTISCSGTTSCEWRGDNPPSVTGFVRCTDGSDSEQTNCPLS